MAQTGPQRHLRIFHFNPWADPLEDAASYLDRLPATNLRSRVAKPDDKDLLQMARLDADWHGETTRAFAAMTHPALKFLPARVTGVAGMLDFAKAARPESEAWWLVFDGQKAQSLVGVHAKLMPLLTRNGVRIALYAFDEASRTMPCFREIAPFLSLLIHDEYPLNPATAGLVPASCRRIHRSWVANLVPFSVPFNEDPEEKILFLGSKLGLTPHRQRQLDYLAKKFGDRFVAIHDHSVSIAERGRLNRFKVSLCPEGRKFDTPAMGATHTDRPFWSGCAGLVSVSEDSRTGGRLESLHTANLIVRYPRGDLKALEAACEKALSVSTEERRRIYDYFNRNETVGTVVATQLHAASLSPDA
jgi:hypothetical protein